MGKALFFWQKWLKSSRLRSIIFRRIAYACPARLFSYFLQLKFFRLLFESEIFFYENSGFIADIPRKKGVSAVVRCVPQKFPLLLSIESIMPFVDEVVLIINTNSKKSFENSSVYFANFPKVKIIQYSETIAPPGPNYLDEVKSNPAKSIARFYNFAFSQSSYLTCVKWDDDMVLNGRSGVLRPPKWPFCARSFNGYDARGEFTTTNELRTFNLTKHTKYFDTDYCERLYLGAALKRPHLKSYVHLKLLRSVFGKFDAL